jgi:hypothetical protein
MTSVPFRFLTMAADHSTSASASPYVPHAECGNSILSALFKSERASCHLTHLCFNTRNYWIFFYFVHDSVFHRTQRFGNWNCVRSQVRRETPTLLRPVERAVRVGRYGHSSRLKLPSTALCPLLLPSFCLQTDPRGPSASTGESSCMGSVS